MGGARDVSTGAAGIGVGGAVGSGGAAGGAPATGDASATDPGTVDAGATVADAAGTAGADRPPLALASFGLGHSYSVGQPMQALAVGDLTGDGRPDLVAATDTGHAVVLRNVGHGMFGPPEAWFTGQLALNAVVIADVNGDGHPDVVVTGEDSSKPGVTVLLNPGDGLIGTLGTFPAPVNGGHPGALAVADMNGDGRPDFVVGCAGICVLFATASNAWGPAVAYGASGARVATIVLHDVNGDGKPDVIAGGPMGVDVALNNGDGTLGARVAYAAGGSVFGAAVGDLDGDGQMDLAVANPDGQRVDLLFAQGGATFGAPTRWGVLGNPWSLVMADFNNDGLPDLASTSYVGAAGNNVFVLINQGGGQFVPGATNAAGSFPEAIVAADFDGDGQIDLAVGNHDSRDVTVLLNATH